LGCGFFPDKGINQAQIAWRQSKQILSKKCLVGTGENAYIFKNGHISFICVRFFRNVCSIEELGKISSDL
jgi:hypothetical protein